MPPAVANHACADDVGDRGQRVSAQPHPNDATTEPSPTEVVNRELTTPVTMSKAKPTSATIAPTDGNGTEAADQINLISPPRLISHIHLIWTVSVADRPNCVTARDTVDSYENRRMKRCWY